MLRTIASVPQRLGAWVGGLSAPVLALAGLLVVAGTSAGGYYAYRTYDFVQHDNDFCLSCHLMEEPYELFAESAHRGLGCKACHQPTLVDRSTMALTQIVENPDSIEVHAEVPNEACAACHIDGDPSKWAIVAAGAGHRVHFESDEPELQGLLCVECHSTTLHEFAPTGRTCAQSGCHEDQQVLLAGMADLTTHCAACHNFSTPIPSEVGVEGALAAMSPDRNECLSCHEMRVLVQLPDPDPHEGACAACHDPHTQDTPAGAVESCATADCHGEEEMSMPLHEGLELAVIEDCTACHAAHDFHLNGANCLACHEDIFDDVIRGAPGGAAIASAAPRGGGLLGGVGEPAAARPWWRHPAPAVQQVPPFYHGEHREVACTECHSVEVTHGAITVTEVADCRSCHHTAPESDDCAACHAESETTQDPYALGQTMTFTTHEEPIRRTLPLDHAVHAEEDCAECHTSGLELGAAGVDCGSCHEEHHAPDTDCSACHADAPDDAHPVEQAHVGCAGAGCHQDVPFDPMPRTRDACLVCHQDLFDHRPDGDCAECHAMTGPGGEDR